MPTLLLILGTLFLALFLIVPLVERFGKKHSKQELHKITRWIMPLLMLLLILQALRYFF